MPTSNENVAKNLKAIQKAIVKHNGNCPGQIIEIQMNPHEVERLDFEDLYGIPIVENGKIETGAFHLVCDLDEQTPDTPSSGDTADKRESVTA